MKKYLIICLLIFSIFGLNTQTKIYRYICLASFINEKLATAFLEKVEARNTDAAIERFEQSDATYYRVLYNKPFEDKKSAQKEFGALYESLKELKIKDLWVVESDKLFDKKTKMKDNAEKSDGINDEIKTTQKIKETPIENKSINFEDNIVINDKPSATDKKADEMSKTNDIKLIRLVVEGLEKPDLWTKAEI
ncbi:MAG TPA: SPOR domain-containing protein, partial [Spirochaetota bacterium]|nr:SPOR domain-containing protein [Spirochaetota bacterium]